MGGKMVSVSSTAFSASMAARTVALLKIQPVQPPISRGMTPTVQVAATKDSVAIIAGLINKLMDIESSASSSKGVPSASAAQSDDPWANSAFGKLSEKWSKLTPESAGPGDRSLTRAEKAQEKANWEAYYNGMDQDVVQDFSTFALAAAKQSYGDDPSFQQALKDGTVKIQRGEEVGWTITNGGDQIIYNTDGYYSGVSGGGGKFHGYDNLAVWKDGKTYAAADASLQVARIAINNHPAYITWPDPPVRT
jgi:hypothetical protein